ncbi:hypothetical protein ZWY2020_018970 [Hordeum vulgare]|nr:hypothetical protein ZWY2020_018970 [Hordeum vulgare]
MRIRRCASRLLGSAAAAPPASCASTEPPRFELPPPAPPAPAHESRPGFVAPEASSSGEPCCELSRSPWDLMNQLDLSDPQEISSPPPPHPTSRSVLSCLAAACCIEPNSFCSYHSDEKPKTTGSENPQRKRHTVILGDGFYYYAGFGPGTKKRPTSNIDSVAEPKVPPEPLKEEAPSEMEHNFSAASPPSRLARGARPLCAPAPSPAPAPYRFGHPSASAVARAVDSFRPAYAHDTRPPPAASRPPGRRAAWHPPAQRPPASCCGTASAFVKKGAVVARRMLRFSGEPFLARSATTAPCRGGVERGDSTTRSPVWSGDLLEPNRVLLIVEQDWSCSFP